MIWLDMEHIKMFVCLNLRCWDEPYIMCVIHMMHCMRGTRASSVCLACLLPCTNEIRTATLHRNSVVCPCGANAAATPVAVLGLLVVNDAGSVTLHHHEYCGTYTAMPCHHPTLL
jgi:hypothetical protein